MTPDQFDKVINLAQYVATLYGIIAGGVFAIWKWIDRLQTKDAEQSVGQRKIKELEEIIADLKFTVGTLKIQVERLATGYQELMDRITSNYFGKKDKM